MTKQCYENYKETGNSWLGKAPSEWQVRRADFVIKSRKLQISPSELEDRDVYHYAIPTVQVTGAGAVEEGESIDSGKLIINEPQVLVSKLNPRKATVTIAEPHPEYLTVASTEFVPLIPWEADLNYMFYVWKSQKVTDRLSSFVQSVTRSHQRCDPAEITKIPWAWPSQGEQQKIAAFLDRKTAEIDTLIAKKRRLLDRLAEKRTALITRAVTKGLNPDAPMKDSGIEWLGEIPAHWDVRSIRRVSSKVRTGSTPPSTGTDYFCDEGVDWYTPGDISDDITLEGATKSVSQEAVDDGVCRLFPSNSVLIVGIGATLGKIAISNREFSANQQINVVLTLPAVEHRYLAYYLYSRRAELKMMSAASTLGIINQERTKQFPCPFPLLQEQREIAEYCRKKIAETADTESKIDAAVERLKEYRSALITNAVTGQIKVA